MATTYINDAQTYNAQSNVPIEIHTTFIWSAMREQVVHTVDTFLCDRLYTASIVHTANATHTLPLFVSDYRLCACAPPAHFAGVAHPCRPGTTVPGRAVPR